MKRVTVEAALWAFALGVAAAHQPVLEIGAHGGHEDAPADRKCGEALRAVTGVCRVFGRGSTACQFSKAEHSQRCGHTATDFPSLGEAGVTPLQAEEQEDRFARRVFVQHSAAQVPLLRQEALQAAAEVGAAEARTRQARKAVQSMHPGVVQSPIEKVSASMTTALSNHKAERISAHAAVVRLASLTKSTRDTSSWFSGRMSDESQTPNLGHTLDSVASQLRSAAASKHFIAVTSAEKALASELGETTEPALRPNMIVALKGGSDGQYCSGGGRHSTCSSSTIGNLEKFHVVAASDGYVGLKGGDKLCNSKKAHTSKEECHEGHMSELQKFKVLNVGPNRVALLSAESGKYCSDRPTGVVCSADDISPAEKFAVQCIEGCQDEPEPVAGAQKISPSSEKTSDTGCAFNQLTNNAGADVSGDGCAKGQRVDHGKACSFSKPGFVCSPALCSNGAWTASKCIRNSDCFFDDLQKPSGATSHGDGCVQGGTVAGGKRCDFEKAGHTCTSSSCSGGQWQDVSICKSRGCSFSSITLPVVNIVLDGQNATKSVASLDQECQAKQTVSSGRTCSFSLSGYTCEVTTCSQGQWNNVAPKCNIDNNEAESTLSTALQDEMKAITREEGKHAPASLAVAAVNAANNTAKPAAPSPAPDKASEPMAQLTVEQLVNMQTEHDTQVKELKAKVAHCVGTR